MSFLSVYAADYVFIFLWIVCMTNWMPRLDGLRGPRYLAIADALARDVRAGRLRPGDRLPPQRLLADLLGLHLSTVTRAYREAARRGLISGMTRRGTVVLDMPHAAALFAPRPDGTGRIDLRTNVPAAFPADAAFDRLFAGLLADQGLPALMRYRTGEEWRTLTADAAGWLTRGGLSLAHHTLVLCAGGQHALDLALGLCASGREIAVEAWTWPGMKTVAGARGLSLTPLALDHEGVLPAALEQAARAGVRVAVLSPSLHNPTGASMGPARRAAIAEVARRHGLWLIEEDVYGLLASRPAPPLAALLPERVLYLTSLSKTVAPGLRLGLLALPHELASARASLLPHSAWYLSPLCVHLACRMIASGLAEQRLAWQRHELAARNRAFDAGFGLLASGGTCCPHRWLPLRPGAPVTDLVARLEQAGVCVLDGADLAVGVQAPALRLALGAAADRAALRAAGAVVRAVCDGLLR